MRNPHLDNLTASDRLILFLVWSLIGFISAYALLSSALFIGTSIIELVVIPALIAIFCGFVAAVWPHQIKALIKSMWG